MVDRGARLHRACLKIFKRSAGSFRNMDGPGLAGVTYDRGHSSFCLEEIETMAQTTTSRETQPHAFVVSIHGIRYQVKDVARSVAFYTTHLGFTLQHQQLPAFASVTLGDAQILLSGPGASGSRPLPDGQKQEPGGWN